MDGMGDTFKSLKENWDWKEVKPDQGLLIYLMRA